MTTMHHRLTPRLEACREKILAAAEKAFLDKGYHASVDDITVEAGVVRQTLYNHFATKDDLFAEVVKRLGKHLLVALESGEGDLRTVLLAFGRTLRISVLGDKWVALNRMMIAEAERFPSLAKTLYVAGVGRTTAQLAALLEREMVAGRLVSGDPQFAAETLLVLLVEPERNKRLFGVAKMRRGDDDHVERVVDLFLRIFGSTPVGAMIRAERISTGA